MSSPWVQRIWLGVAVTVTVTACSSLPYSPRPLDAEATAPEYAQRSGNADGLKRFAVANGYSESAWPPVEWGLRELTLAALYFHPDIRTARARGQVARAELYSVRQPQALSARVTPSTTVASFPRTAGRGASDSAGNPSGGAAQRARRAWCFLADAADVDIAAAGWRSARQGARPVVRSAGQPSRPRAGRGTAHGTQGNARPGGAPGGRDCCRHAISVRSASPSRNSRGAG
jgi:hypothetical protein